MACAASIGHTLYAFGAYKQSDGVALNTVKAFTP